MRTVSLVVAVLMMLVGVNAKAELGDDLPTTPKAEKTQPSLVKVVSSFESGKTTYSEVVALLGEPQQQSQSNAGRGVSYSDKAIKHDAISYAPVIGAFVGKTTTTGSTAQLMFDKNDVLIQKFVW